jgi:hypothetical protein
MFATIPFTLSAIFAGAFLSSAGARVLFPSLLTLPTGCRAQRPVARPAALRHNDRNDTFTSI